MNEAIEAVLGKPPHTPDDVRSYVDGRNDLVHAAYLYGCSGCKRSEFVYLGVGIEGPDRERAWIPSPFMGGVARSCGGETQHIAWHLDQRFRAPIDPPFGALYFRVPDNGPDPRLYGSSVFAGETKRAPILSPPAVT